MKYICDQGHKFIHPGISVKSELSQLVIDTIPQIHTESTFTLHVCPVCKSQYFDDYQEPQPEITSVKSVDLSQVDEYLKQGYVVHELYAKTATMKKVSVPCSEPSSEPLQSPPVHGDPCQQEAEEAYKKLEGGEKR